MLGLTASRWRSGRHPAGHTGGAASGGSQSDLGITGRVVLGLALPAFVTGPLLALFFGVYLQWLPAGGWEKGSLRYFVLPAFTLAFP